MAGFMIALALTHAAVAAPAATPDRPVIRDCRACPDLVAVPAGSALLGSTAQERGAAGIVPLFGDREKPQYRVTFVSGFLIGRTEVTRGQYRDFVLATGHPTAPTCGIHDAPSDSWGPQPGYNWTRPGFAQNDNHPAVCISYDDARAYTAWLSRKTGKAYRLPSDAEWEYASRGGTQTAWYWGNAPEAGCARANLLSAGTIAVLGSPKSTSDRLVCANPRSFTVPVASYSPNQFGLFDMAGNAFEWVADCNNPDNSDAHPDGTARTTGDCDKHYLKGGAFHTPFWLTRSAVRGAPIPADLHMFAVGFRIARSID